MRGPNRQAQNRGNVPSPGSLRDPTSPRAAGRGKEKRSRDALRPSFAKKSEWRVANSEWSESRSAFAIRYFAISPSRIFASLDTVYQKRRAKRRQTRNLPSASNGCGRALKRSALVCRRSTAALAAANQRRRSASERASWDAASLRRYLKADLSQSSDKVADRSSCRPGVFPKPPGSGGDEPPPAGTALAPASRRHRLPSFT